METFADRVIDRRRRAVLTQQELAKKAGVAFVTINRLENGAITNPRPETVRKLAKALNVKPAWLLFGDEADQGKAAA